MFEIFGFVNTFAIGLWYAMPWQVFLIFPVYEHMASLAPEWAWGIAFMSVALFKAYCFFTEKYQLRLVATVIGISFWIFILAMFAQGNWHSAFIPTVMMYILLKAFVGYALVRGIKKRKVRDAVLREDYHA